MKSAYPFDLLLDLLQKTQQESTRLMIDISILVSIFHEAVHSYADDSTLKQNHAVMVIFLALATVVKYNRDLVEDIIRIMPISQESYDLFHDGD